MGFGLCDDESLEQNNDDGIAFSSAWLLRDVLSGIPAKPSHASHLKRIP
jgi:hypothetical protein